MRRPEGRGSPPGAVTTGLGCRIPDRAWSFWALLALVCVLGEVASGWFATAPRLASALAAASLLALALAAQLAVPHLIEPLFWFASFAVYLAANSTVDGALRRFGVDPRLAAMALIAGLAAGLVSWYRIERSLHIDRVTTRRHESFFWWVVAVGLALGSAVGHVVAEQLALDHSPAALVFMALLAASALGYLGGLDPTFTFWTTLVLLGPFVSSLFDFATTARGLGGLGIDPTAVGGTALVVLIGIGLWWGYTTRRG